MKHESSHRIEFVNQRRLPAEPRQTILGASLKAGFALQHACGGNAKCSTCRVLVVEGGEFLSPPTEAERALAERMSFSKNVRLSCQTRLNGGPVRLRRLIRDEFDRKMFTESAPRSLGEERELALFFLDIRDFTPFVESNLPFDVIHILSRFHAMVRKVVSDCDGQVIEVAGDGVYAVFGLGTPLAEAVASAVRAGSRILEEVETFSRDYLSVHFSVQLDVGIGLHAGRVICGEVGVGVGGAFTAIGLPVNVASRLEDATKELNNNFVISETAYALLADAPKAPAAEVALKGVAGPCPVRLLGKPYHEKGSRKK